MWARRRDPSIREWFDRAAIAGEIAICNLVLLELLRYTAARDFERLERDLLAFPMVTMIDLDWSLSRDIQRELARQTAQDHRKVKLPDLLIAAAAARLRLPLVHYDDDFDRIQRITGQPMRWVAERGSLG